VLAVLGVAPEDVAADHALSAERLRAAGLTDDDLAALRARLLAAPSRG